MLTSAIAPVVLIVRFVASLSASDSVYHKCVLFNKNFLKSPKLRDLQSTEEGITKLMDYSAILPVSPVL